jgi:hypothetical protein
MYKRQFRLWKMRKYYAQDQKRELLQHLARSSQHNSGAESLCINGKPIKASRLYRLVKQNGKTLRLTLKRPRSSKTPSHVDSSPYNRSTHAALRNWEHGHIPTSIDLDNVAAILVNAHRYYNWYLSQTQIASNYAYPVELYDLLNNLSIGGQHQDTNPSLSFALVNKSCSAFQSLLVQQPMLMLQELISLFTRPLSSWRRHTRLRASVLKFFASLAEVKLYAQHPISAALRLFTAIDQVDCEALLNRYAHLLVAQFKTDANKSVPTSFELDIASMLIDANEMDAAASILDELWQSAQPGSSRSTAHQKYIISGMIDLNIKLRDFEKAQMLLDTQIRWTIEATGRPNGDLPGVCACWRSGYLNKWLGNLDTSGHCYQLALQGVVGLKGYSLSYALDILVELEGILAKQDKNDEIAVLREKYADLWAETGQWRVEKML